MDEPGEAAVHGSVIDVFPPAAATPYRIDHADGAITEIRPFDAATQRSQRRDVAAVVLGPASEAVLDEARRADRPEQGMEQLLPSLYPALTTIFAAMPDADIILDPETDALVAQHEADIRDAFRSMGALVQAENGAATSPWTLYLDHACLAGGPARPHGHPSRGDAAAPAGALPRFARPADFVRFVRERAAAGARIGLTGPERHRRTLAALAGPAGRAPARRLVTAPGGRPGDDRAARRHPRRRFQTDEAVVIAPADVLGARARRQAAGTTATFETAMAPGDAVIHFDHGLGRAARHRDGRSGRVSRRTACSWNMRAAPACSCPPTRSTACGATGPTRAASRSTG